MPISKLCIISGTDAATVGWTAQQYADQNHGTYVDPVLTTGLYFHDLDSGTTFTTTADWVSVANIPYDEGTP
jgi:hypothetical protein